MLCLPPPPPDCCVDKGPWRAGDGHRGGAEEPSHCAQHQGPQGCGQTQPSCGVSVEEGVWKGTNEGIIRSKGCGRGLMRG